MTPTAAQQLAEIVVVDGFGPHEAELAALLAGARHRGVCQTLVSVAADATEPEVVRQRALGRIVVEYRHLTNSTRPASVSDAYFVENGVDGANTRSDTIDHRGFQQPGRPVVRARADALRRPVDRQLAAPQAH